MTYAATKPIEGLSQTSAPSVEPMTTAEAQTHCRVVSGTDDTYIDTLIASARRKVEHDTSAQLITATWAWKIEDFPASDVLFVPKSPLQSVSSITYIDTNGDSQTFASSKYDLGLTSQRGRIALAWGEVWPTVRKQIDAVTITFIAGYGDASTDIPDDLIHANKLLVSHWYEYREPVVDGQPPRNVPKSYDALISNYRRNFF